MVEFIFPLHNAPSADYHKNSRYFGAWLSGGTRKHAGYDLNLGETIPVAVKLDISSEDFQGGCYLERLAKEIGKRVKYIPNKLREIISTKR